MTDPIQRLMGRDLAFRLQVALSPAECVERLEGGFAPLAPDHRVRLMVEDYKVDANAHTVTFDLRSKIEPSIDVYTMRVNVQFEADPAGSQVIVTPRYRSIHWQIIPGIIFAAMLISAVTAVFIGAVGLATAIGAAVGLVWVVAQTQKRSDVMLAGLRTSLKKVLT